MSPYTKRIAELARTRSFIDSLAAGGTNPADYIIRTLGPALRGLHDDPTSTVAHAQAQAALRVLDVYEAEFAETGGAR